MIELAQSMVSWGSVGVGVRLGLYGLGFGWGCTDGGQISNLDVTAVQSATIIGYTSCIVSVMDRPQQRERARKRAASVTKKLDMRFCS